MLGSRVTCFANAHGDSDAYSHAHPNANRYTHSDRSDSGSVLPHYADRDTRGDAPDSRTCSGRGPHPQQVGDSVVLCLTSKSL